MPTPDSETRLKGDSPAAAKPQVLADRRELAFVAMEFTRMAMVVTDVRDPGHPIVLANRAFLELTGYSSEEVLGRNCRFLQGPETDKAAIAKIRNALHKDEGITLELLNYRKDGSAFWNELRICPVHDEQGQLLYHFASQYDVSDRHRVQALEAAEHLLLREIEHRAKNALALVQGIVRMSSADTAENFAKLVQGRVDALSNAHIVLAKGGWKAVPLRQVLEAELANMDDGQAIVLTGPVLSIGAAQVQPLSLVLHEVIDNAIRHGSLSADGGTMTISWWTEADRTVIELRETGGPSPASTRTTGFGTKMINAIIERQLGGSVALDWHPNGLTSMFAVPGMTVQ